MPLKSNVYFLINPKQSLLILRISSILVVFSLLQFGSSSLLAQTRLTPKDQAPKEHRVLSNSIAFLESSSGRCSAVRVGRSPLYLTARHCLQGCLIREGVFQFADSFPMDVIYYRLDRDQMSKSLCNVVINSIAKEISITSTSPGFIPRINERSMELLYRDKYHKLVQKGFTSEGDYVIFEILDQKNLNPDEACLELETHTSENGQEVFSLGYPSQTHREDGMNSDGVNLFYTSGKIKKSILQNSCLEEIELSSRQREDLLKRFEFESSFISSLDVTFGSSGSPVINQNFKIQGILTNVYDHSHHTQNDGDKPVNRYCQGSAKALETSTIINHLRNQNIDLEKFKCH